MADLARREALGGETGVSSYTEADFSLCAVTDRCITRLQWRVSENAEISQLERLTNLKLPDGPLSPAGDDPSVFWCAPGEWLIVHKNLRAADLRKALEGLPESVNHTATEAGSGLACIRISGDGAPDRLARGCSAALQETDKGYYLLTRLFGLPALVHKIDDSPVFDLYIDRSTSRWLWDCLLA